MSDFYIVSAELAGKIREFLHGEADYDARALLREVVRAQADLEPYCADADAFSPREREPGSTNVCTADSDRLPEM